MVSDWSVDECVSKVTLRCSRSTYGHKLHQFCQVKGQKFKEAATKFAAFPFVLPSVFCKSFRLSVAHVSMSLLAVYEILLCEEFRDL